MYATVLMDVEDLIDPDADDIAGVCSDILAEEGIRATMCIVGEKARLLKSRGRQDIISKLNQHDIGYHTNYHSVHPTISEYLAPLDWDAGVAAALLRESPGVEAIRDVFGVTPSCLGGPGNTWGPQACEAMRQLGVPAFVYAYTAVPSGGPHQFAGLIAYPHGRSLNDGLYQEDDLAVHYINRLRENLASDAAAGLFWQQAFVGHPTRIQHEHFWDDPVFAYGANPPKEQWTAARRKTPADLERALQNFRKSMREIKNMPGIELKTIREMNHILSKQPHSPITEAEQAAIWPSIENSLARMGGWCIQPPDIDLSGICRLTQAKLGSLERFVV